MTVLNIAQCFLLLASNNNTIQHVSENKDYKLVKYVRLRTYNIICTKDDKVLKLTSKQYNDLLKNKPAKATKATTPKATTSKTAKQ